METSFQKHICNALILQGSLPLSFEVGMTPMTLPITVKNIANVWIQNAATMTCNIAYAQPKQVLQVTAFNESSVLVTFDNHFYFDWYIIFNFIAG